MTTVNNTKAKVAVIYTRVSSQEQVTNFSLDNQEKMCREFATRGGFEILKVFREEGESAKTADRTELNRMMLYCDKNKKIISRLIVYKIDRLSRSVNDYQSLRIFFNKLGISVISATENFKDDPAGKFNENILSAVAQFDNDMKSQRTIEGMKSRLLNGYWSTIAPWGYVNTKDELGSKIISPHPERSPVVRMLFEEYATGKYTFKELADRVKKMGLKSLSKTFTKQLVAKIIKNPIYYGAIKFPKFGISTMGNHKPIITEALFNEAQLAKSKFANRKIPRSQDNPLYPLRGVKCGGCGRSITGGKTKGRHRYYEYYGCYCSECSKRTVIKKEEFEKDFTVFLERLTPDDQLFEILKEAIKIAYKQEFESTVTTKRKLEIQILEKKTKKDKLLDLRLAETLSNEDFIVANEKIKSEIAQLERSVCELIVPELDLENVINSSLNFLKTLPEEWKNLNVKDLRVLRELIFPQNIEYSYPGFKTAELSIVYKLKSEFPADKNPNVPLAGIEPAFLPSQGSVLSIERQERFKYINTRSAKIEDLLSKVLKSSNIILMTNTTEDPTYTETELTHEQQIERDNIASVKATVKMILEAYRKGVSTELVKTRIEATLEQAAIPFTRVDVEDDTDMPAGAEIYLAKIYVPESWLTDNSTETGISCITCGAEETVDESELQD